MPIVDTSPIDTMQSPAPPAPVTPLPAASLYALRSGVSASIARGAYIYTLVTDPSLRASWQQVRPTRAPARAASSLRSPRNVTAGVIPIH